jgi:hypothetical protein
MLSAQLTFRLDSRNDRFGRFGEGTAEGVAHGLKDISTMLRNYGAQKPIVIVQRKAHCIRMQFPRSSAALDVRE